MAQIPAGSLHKFLTGEVVDGDNAPTGASLNPVFETIRVAQNDTDTKINTLNTQYNAALIGLDYTQVPYNMSQQAIINGNFDVWQRGTSFTGFVYNADRWLMRGDGSGEVSTTSRQPFTVGQGVVPNEPKYFWRKQVTTAPTGQTYHQFAQRIESVRNFAGSKLTVSFWAKADAPRTISTLFQQIFGTGGSPSSPITIASQNHSLTTSWQKFTATFTIPSISGKTLGTNGDDYLEFDFILPVNSLMTIDIAQVQINAGNVALSFQPRSFADELALCQRYYEKSYDYGTAPATSTGVGMISKVLGSNSIVAGQEYGDVRFRVAKRITPTITIYPFTTPTNTGQVSAISGADLGANSGVISSNGTTGFRSSNGSGTTLTTSGNAVIFHYAADAEI